MIKRKEKRTQKFNEPLKKIYIKKRPLGYWPVGFHMSIKNQFFVGLSVVVSSKGNFQFDVIFSLQTFEAKKITETETKS